MGQLRLGGYKNECNLSPISKLIIVPTLDFDPSRILLGVVSIPLTMGWSGILPGVRSVPPTTGQSVFSSKGFAFGLGLVLQPVVASSSSSLGSLVSWL